MKQSCRVSKVEQLSFLEIFNFFRKIVINLQNKLSGNSVILLNSSTTTAPPPASFLRSSRRARGRHWLHAGTGWSLRVVPSLSWPRYKASTPSSAFLSLLCFATTATVVLRRSPLPQPCIPCQNWPRHKFRLSLVHLLEPATAPRRAGVGRATSSSSRPVSAPPSSVAPWPESFSRFLLQPDSVRASW